MKKIILLVSFTFLTFSVLAQSKDLTGTWTVDTEKSTGVSAEKAGGKVTISQDKTTFKYGYSSSFNSATLQCLLDGTLTKFKVGSNEGKCLYKQVSNVQIELNVEIEGSRQPLRKITIKIEVSANGKTLSITRHDHFLKGERDAVIVLTKAS